VNITFATDNDAYRDPADARMLDRYGVAETIREIAEAVEGGRESGVVMDVNGNRVGEWSL